MKVVLSLFFSLILAFAAFGQQSVGSPAQSFDAYTLNGKPISLNQMRGKVVVMMFWSTRSAPCHAEIPKLNEIAAKYTGQNVEFLGLTMNNEARVNDYLKEQPFNFTIITNGLGIVMQYSDKDSAGRLKLEYPLYFIIDQAGQVTQKLHGLDKTGKIDSEIKRLLAK